MTRHAPPMIGLSLLAPLALTGCAGGTIPVARTPQRAPLAAPTYAAVPEGGRCLTELGQRRAAFTPLADRYYGAGCSTAGTVQLAALQGDQALFRLSNMGPVTCQLADTLAGWARFGVDRAARQILGSPLVRIETMGSYSCRNVAGTARRSGHATAQAVDIGGFELADGRRIRIASNWNDADPSVRQFLRVVRGSACKRFAMVLSPDYNAAHRDHLHVEVNTRPLCS